MINQTDLSVFTQTYRITDLTYETQQFPKYLDCGSGTHSVAYVNFSTNRLWTMKLRDLNLAELVNESRDREIELNIRRHNPAVAKAYDHYRMLLNLTKYEYGQYTKNNK